MPVGGAAVTAGNLHTVETGGDGAFRIDLPPGRHTLVVSRSGYADSKVRLDVASTPAAVDVVLEALARFSENVTVVGGARAGRGSDFQA